MDAENTIQRLRARLQDRKTRLLLALGLSGLFLLFLGNTLSAERRETEMPAADSLAATARETEERLASILSRIDGVGRVWVMVTLDADERAVYAVNGQTSESSGETVSENSAARREETSSSQQSYLLVGDSSSRTPLPLTREGPKVRGAVVVCGGGENAVVRAAVIEAVTTALGITSDRVCVLRAG